MLTKASVYHQTPLISLGHFPGLIVFRCKNFSPSHKVFSFFFSFLKTDPAQWLAITSPEEEDGKSEEKESAGIRGLEHGTSWVEVHVSNSDLRRKIFYRIS